ncbi:MAG: hypothetical protein ACRD5M_13010 [Candidatus Acidiferrales bacterium]
MRSRISLMLLVLATLTIAVQFTPTQASFMQKSAALRDGNGPMPPWLDGNGPMPPWRDGNGPMPPWQARA